MKYLEKLIERNEKNKALKNKAMGRNPRTPAREVGDREVHDHGSNPETMGRLRGVKKVKGAKPKKMQYAHTEYKRMGALMAEALGYRIDELAPLLAAPLAVAGKAAGLAARGVAAGGKAALKGAGAAAKGIGKAAAGAAKQTVRQGARGAAEGIATSMMKRREQGDEVTEAKKGDPEREENKAARDQEKSNTQAAQAKRNTPKLRNRKAYFDRNERQERSDERRSAANNEVDEATEPTEKDLAKANKDVHTKKRVKGETPKETEKVNKSIDKAMGKPKKGAKGGIEGLRASIYAAGRRGRERRRREMDEARGRGGRTSYDHDAQEDAAKGHFGKEVQKSDRATANAGSGISRRLKSGEQPSFRGQKTTYNRDQTAGKPESLITKTKKKSKKKKIMSHTIYKQIGMALAEAHQAYTDPQAKKELKQGKADAGYAGPIARKAAKSKDPVVKRGQKAAGRRIEKKVPGAKASKISKVNLTQAALLARRKKMRKNKVGLPKETPEIAKADAKRDVYRRMAPGDK